ncbi:hypothetical protein OEB99_00150 [Actinotalea sp. M2MS4P-6]|uniref:hypothetical protein n=1 Tax=Actinotalea sp. M2MS4P-6 TaxID=2983762 RepID=UPI0021E4FFAB|nr:hypothetical protein [Actinotalea sp. M2MS4P-6]MCV2392708.1 hypothetical protein [Actinotalea sp. M2MS4P-6]
MWHRVAAVGAGLVAASAIGGAIGLATGADPYLVGLHDRLPLQSPVLGGVLLTAAVGAPYSALAARTWRRDERSGLTAVVAGVAMVGWLCAEAAWLREVSTTELVFGTVGLATAALGVRAARPR